MIKPANISPYMLRRSIAAFERMMLLRCLGEELRAHQNPSEGIHRRGSAKGVQVQALNEFCGAEAGSGRERERSTYLYVWGAVKYDDGFKKMRTTRFCHRYNWIARKQHDNPYVIDAADARYHEYGNAAD